MGKEELREGVQVITFGSAPKHASVDFSVDPIVQIRKDAKGRTTFVRESGQEFELGEGAPKKEAKAKKLTFKAQNALNILSLLTREIFSHLDDGSNQDAYYTEKERQINWDGYAEDDIRECFRQAASFVANEGVGAREAASEIVKDNPRHKDFSEEKVNRDIGTLANGLRVYYPANFPKSATAPAKR